MDYSTTGQIEGREVDAHLGVVFGDAVAGVNVVRDFLGGLRDIFGGRSATYERGLGEARDAAMGAMTAQAHAMGADAILGIDLDYEVLGNMLVVCASGTAVRLKPVAGAAPWTRP